MRSPWWAVAVFTVALLTLSQASVATPMATVASGAGHPDLVDTAGPRDDADGVAVDWVWRGNGSVVATPAVSNGTVFVGITAGAYPGAVRALRRGAPDASVGAGGVAALDGATGAQLWRTPVDGSVYGAPAVADGRVYVGTLRDTVYAVEATTGRVAWTADLGHPVVAPPTVTEGRVYVGTRDLEAHERANSTYPLYALDADDGEALWRVGIDEGVFGAPAVAGDAVVVGGQNGTVTVLDASDGSRRWRYRTPDRPSADDPVVRYGGVAAAPSTVGETVYLTSYAGDVVALATRNGSERWRTTLPGPIASSPAVRDGRLYVGNYTGSLVALDARTGHQRWDRSLSDGVTKSSPIAEGEVFYIGGARFGSDAGGAIYAIDGDDGSTRWRHATERPVRSSPVLAAGRLLYAAGDVVALSPVGRTDDGGGSVVPPASEEESQARETAGDDAGPSAPESNASPTAESGARDGSLPQSVPPWLPGLAVGIVGRRRGWGGS